MTELRGERIVSARPLGPDLILLNGNVFTADRACRYAQAVAISGSRISAVGTNNEIAATADARTQRIDLVGRTVIPGINDSHFHLTNYIQKGLTIRDYLAIMGNKVGRSALFGIPLQQTWAYENSGDFAPTFVSENIRDWLGYAPEEYLKGADFWRSRVHPDDLAATEAESVNLFKHGRHTVEYRFLRKDGGYCWVNDAQQLMRDKEGQTIEVIGSWSDVTARKQAEEAIAAANVRVRHLLARSPAVIYAFEASGDYKPTFISQNIKELLGYEAEEYLEGPDFWRSRVHPADLARIEKGYTRLFEEGHLFNEYRFRK